MEHTEEAKRKTRGQRFVAAVLQRLQRENSRGFAARMRRADNPDTEHQSWGDLMALGVNIEKDAERLPYALVGAALCRQKTPGEGSLGLGEALRGCFSEIEQGEMRLRRLLACGSISELAGVLRPVLRLVASKNDKPVCWADLLDDLLYFQGKWRQRILLRWASGYYGRAADAAVPQGGQVGTLPATPRHEAGKESGHAAY